MGGFEELMRDGSIPALAGERASASSGTKFRRVYPRACGGTFSIFLIAVLIEGLSPRLRGNVDQAGVETDCVGSIPALAGERNSDGSCPVESRVYPRACGGTKVRRLQNLAFMGLSPRLRGNAVTSVRIFLSPGSIPALAGERPRSSDP